MDNDTYNENGVEDVYIEEKPKRNVTEAGKRLYKADKRGQFSGVSVGLADYFGIDESLVRIIFVVGALLSTGVPFVLIYIVLAIVLPDEKDIYPERYAADGTYLGKPV